MMVLMRMSVGAAMAALLAFPAAAQNVRPDQAQYRAVFQELVETNTTLASGSCTLAAEKMAARLRGAGFPASDLHLIVTPANPKEGSLVAVLPGGAGSLDEFFEVLTWAQIGLHRKPIFLISTDGYWQPLLALIDHVIAEGFADPALRDLFTVVADAAALEAAMPK